MTREQLFYLIPYGISLAVLAAIFLYAVRQPYIRGALSFAWMVFGQALNVLAFILEAVSPDLSFKIVWDAAQWLVTACLIILPFLVFVVQFAEHRLPSPSLTWGMILTFLGVFATFLLSDPIHRLFYINPRIIPGEPVAQLRYDFTLVMYLYSLLYVFGANVYGISLLTWKAFQPRNLFRTQYLIVAAGFLIPLIVSILELVEIDIFPPWSLLSMAFATSSLIVAWGLFRFSLFDIAPLARRHIVENMHDPVIVLDPRDRIVDINTAALTFLDKQRSDAIGRPLETAFTRWTSLIETLKDPYLEQSEINLPLQGNALSLAISGSRLVGQRLEPIGRVITIRDVTRERALEAAYDRLSREVEQRIRQRTEELEDIAERYRSLVENQPDFIVRWKPDGTRTFVNEAYCRYWDITLEQALARNFLFHAPEEDRPDVEKKIVRLNAGMTDVETETHRVIKPDGTTAWHEWLDKAIRDEWGKLTEIQSAGRDITERKQSEEKQGG